MGYKLIPSGIMFPYESSSVLLPQHNTKREESPWVYKTSLLGSSYIMFNAPPKKLIPFTVFSFWQYSQSYNWLAWYC